MSNNFPQSDRVIDAVVFENAYKALKQLKASPAAKKVITKFVTSAKNNENRNWLLSKFKDGNITERDVMVVGISEAITDIDSDFFVSHDVIVAARAHDVNLYLQAAAISNLQHSYLRPVRIIDLEQQFNAFVNHNIKELSDGFVANSLPLEKVRDLMFKKRLETMDCICNDARRLPTLAEVKAVADAMVFEGCISRTRASEVILEADKVFQKNLEKIGIAPLYEERYTNTWIKNRRINLLVRSDGDYEIFCNLVEEWMEAILDSVSDTVK
jgi:hypothetical protein